MTSRGSNQLNAGCGTRCVAHDFLLSQVWPSPFSLLPFSRSRWESGALRGGGVSAASCCSREDLLRWGTAAHCLSLTQCLGLQCELDLVCTPDHPLLRGWKAFFLLFMAPGLSCMCQFNFYEPCCWGRTVTKSLSSCFAINCLGGTLAGSPEWTKSRRVMMSGPHPEL